MILVAPVSRLAAHGKPMVLEGVIVNGLLKGVMSGNVLGMDLRILPARMILTMAVVD